MTQPAKHTPAPWSLEYDHSLVMGGQVVGQAPCPDGVIREEQIANARLISAAPELLAACEKAEELLSPFEESGFLGEQALNIVRAAIAKARGAA